MDYAYLNLLKPTALFIGAINYSESRKAAFYRYPAKVDHLSPF